MREIIGVLRGGPSSEYDVSLRSGASVLEAIDKEKYEPRDLFISKNGEWHLHGVPVSPEKALGGVDVAINVIHGQFGEDGQVQRILDMHGVPYTGSDAFSSAIMFNKQQTKDVAAKLGIKVPLGVMVNQEEDLEKVALQLFRSFPHPAIVKPVIGGSSVGVTKVEHFHALQHALEHAFQVSPKVLVEEFIQGKEATVGVIDSFRGAKSYALMPVEIVPASSHGFFTYDAKYGGETIERVPGNFTDTEKNTLERMAVLAHEGLGASHYSRSDFIVSKRGIYFLEINSAAAVGMTKESLFPKALYAVGSTLSDFVDHIIGLARAGKRK